MYLVDNPFRKFLCLNRFTLLALLAFFWKNHFFIIYCGYTDVEAAWHTSHFIVRHSQYETLANKYLYGKSKLHNGISF